jgi:molecular chaperone GrpE
MARKEKAEDPDNYQGEEMDEKINETETENIQPESETNVNSGLVPTCEERFAELNNKYVRLYSDFDNFRKRTIKEKSDIITSASANVIKDLLVVLDDFERAISNNENVEDANMLKEGFKLIQHKLVLSLQSKGLEPVEAKGEIFDADKHEAITNVPVEDKNQKGKVIDVVERGYNLYGKSLRYAKVIVGQ